MPRCVGGAIKDDMHLTHRPHARVHHGETGARKRFQLLLVVDPAERGAVLPHFVGIFDVAADHAPVQRACSRVEEIMVT